MNLIGQFFLAGSPGVVSCPQERYASVSFIAIVSILCV